MCIKFFDAYKNFLVKFASSDLNGPERPTLAKTFNIFLVVL